jgi:hypothetical protein
VQLNPSEIAEVIRQRIEGISQKDDSAEAKDDDSCVTVTAILDSERVRKMSSLHQMLGAESRADALATVIDIAAEIVPILQAGGRVTLHERSGRASSLNLKRLA